MTTMKTTRNNRRKDNSSDGPVFALGLVKSIGKEGDDYDIKFVCSTDVVDRSDEVIEQDGWELANFQKNPVFLAAHMHRLADGRSPVIGSFTSVGVTEGKLEGTVRFADTELGREYKTLYTDKHMRAVSVGFQPKAGETRRDDDGQKRYHHTKQELYETSAVAVGCNQEALSRLTHAPVDRAPVGGGIATPVYIRRAISSELEKFGEELVERMLAEFTEMKEVLLEGLDEIKSLLPDGDDIDGDSDDEDADASDAPAGDESDDDKTTGDRSGAAQVARRLVANSQT